MAKTVHERRQFEAWKKTCAVSGVGMPPSFVQRYCIGDELRRAKVSKIEENLANQAEPILGFKPFSEIKSGATGILISIICIAIVYRELSLAGVI